jgi:hypothetical protein
MEEGDPRTQRRGIDGGWPGPVHATAVCHAGAGDDGWGARDEDGTGGIHGDVAGPHDLVAEGDRAIVRHVGFCSSTRRRPR